MQISGGAIYNNEGEKIADVKDAIIDFCLCSGCDYDFAERSLSAACNAFSFTVKLSRLDRLSLQYGFRVTNNWLKMHGGIMTRKGMK